MRRYLAVLLFALALRLLYVVFIGRVPPNPDSHEYLTIAQNLLNHGAFSLGDTPPFTPTIRRAPVYPAFLGLLHLFGARTHFQIAIAQALLGALSCLLVFHLAKRITTERRATLAACYYSVFPTGLIFVPAVLSETLFTLLLLSAVALAAAGLRRRSTTIIVLAGAMLSLSALCRPISLPLAAVFAVILAFFSSRKLAAFFVLGFALSLAPWAMRTALVSRSFTMIQGYGTCNVYLASQWWLDQKDYQAMIRSFEQSPYGLSLTPYGHALGAVKGPVETVLADKMGMGMAMRNITTNPKAYLLSRLKSWPYLFITSFGGPSLSECWARRSYWRLGVKLFMLLVFSITPIALALLSLRRVRGNPALALCAAVWIFTLVVHLPLWVESRFWAPAFPFLAICAFAVSIADSAAVKSNRQNDCHAGQNRNFSPLPDTPGHRI
jgi:4-amino-4-deoxy-L-arabinose transferase-like glycosyltransferase